MSLDLTTISAQEQLAAIYIGYYDRAADPVGEDFWESAVANPNLSLADIATDFATQPETLIAYPFLDAPTAEEAEGFIAEVFLNLFNRAPDAAGLEFWSGALLSAIAGDEGALSVGEIILAIIEGAQDSAEGNDRTTILNKIEVATTWSDAADAAGIDYASDAAAQSSAKSIIEGVTDEGSTVTSAKATIDGFFTPAPVPGDTYFLTSGTDRGEDFTGTSDDDEFLAYIEQNPFVGGVSNSLSSADHLDGGAGNDRLYAEITDEFVGAFAGGYIGTGTDLQPRLKNIEEIDIEARDNGSEYFGGGEDIIVDAKNITDHVEIGSYYSDGDLRIENLTTLTSSGNARNTSEITITMDHTDNFNSDEDASDLTVYFDNDYLLSGQEAQGQIFYFLLDEDAELAGNPNRLNNIDVDGIRFTIDTGNGPVDVIIEADAANTAGTHQGFVNALQAPLQALIQDGTLPAGTTLTLDPTITDVTFLDDGSQSDTIPAIVLTSGDGSEVIATGFSRIEEEIGEYDVYGRFNSVNEVEDQPVSINIDLHKVGRGGDGGDLIIGGKASRDTADGIEAGIEVFNINVLGAGNDDPNGMMTKPSSLGTIQSTWGVLDVVNIATDPVYAAGDTYASLEVRNGFDGNTSLINADAFLGDLMLYDVTNSDTITAQGGGDVTLGLNYNGSETDTAYSVTTGGGDDTVIAFVDGDALDYLNSSFSVSTGDGMDIVSVNLAVTSGGEDDDELNQAILDNVSIDTGADDDFVQLLGNGVANISTGSGDDTIFTDGGGSNAAWAFNFDALRADQEGGIGDYDIDDLPGEQTSLAYVGGATVTVTLSGAGVGFNGAADGTTSDGGGVMAFDNDDPTGASRLQDGYEANAVISDLINGNDFYGDQRDVNAAIIDAIESDPILSQLLTATIGANNTLVIASTTSGDFHPSDLRIEIHRPTLDSWTAVQTEARSVFSDSTITVNSVATADTPTGQDLESSDGADQWFDGLSARGDDLNSTRANVGETESNLHTNGSASNGEVDTVINGGAGDDLIVLSADSTDSTPDAFTVSSNNALLNGASNETIVLTGDDFGDDTVMNFETAGDNFGTGTATTTLTGTTTTTTTTSGSITTNTTATTTFTVSGTVYTKADGIDFLDFSAYLTSQESDSGSAASERTIDVTLDYDTDADAGEMGANEVVFVRYTNDATESDTFASLTAADVAALYNNSDGTGDYDGTAFADTNFDVIDGQSDNAVVDGIGKGILMVENAGNLGEYKVFEITWDASEADGDEGVTAVELGSLDFGDSLDGMDEINLVGSATHDALLANGFGAGFSGTDIV
jgi:hypothetical protein